MNENRRLRAKVVVLFKDRIESALHNPTAKLNDEFVRVVKNKSDNEEWNALENILLAYLEVKYDEYIDWMLSLLPGRAKYITSHVRM